MIKFKYSIPDDLNELMSKTIMGFGRSYCAGYMPEGLIGQLRHTTLFLMCEYEYKKEGGIQKYKNPIVVVARNDTSAAEIFYEVTGKYGLVLHRITEDCSKLMVEAWED